MNTPRPMTMSPLGTSPQPPLCQWPVPAAASTRRVPPPYQLTATRVRLAVGV